MLRLQLKDPKIVDNYTRVLEERLRYHKIYERLATLSFTHGAELTPEQEAEYEAIDKIRVRSIRLAEKKCRTLKMGNHSYSPEFAQASRTITLWTLILRRLSGRKASAKTIMRQKKKGGLDGQFGCYQGRG